MKAIVLLVLTLFFQLIQIATMFFSLKLASEFLSHNDFIVWVLYLSILPFIILFDGNLAVTLSREISFSYKLKSNIKRINILIDSADYLIKFFLLFVFIIISLIFFLYGIIEKDLDFNIVYPTYLFVFSLIFKVRSNYSLSKVFALGLILEDRVIKIISAIVNLFLIYFLFRLNFGLYSLGLATLFQSMLSIILSYSVISKKIKLFNFKKTNQKIVKRLLIPTKEYLMIAIPGILVLNSGIYFLKIYNASNDIILSYGISVQILSSILGLSMMIPSTFQSIISKTFAKGQDFKFQAITIIKIYYITVFGIMLNLMFFRKEFFMFWIGHDIDDKIFVILFLVYLFEMIQLPATVFCISIGYIKFAKVTIISSLLIVILTYPILLLFDKYSLAYLILIIQLITCHQYNIRKFIFNFSINKFDIYYLIKFMILPLSIIGLILILINISEIQNMLRIVLSAIITILIICIFSLKDLKRISLWLRN